MADQNGDDKDALSRLLGDMPRIAEAVSAFPESVQQQAFDALMAASGNAPATGTTGGGAGGTGAKRQTAKRARQPKDEEGKKTRRKSSGPTQLRDLDLRPKGKTSFKDFVVEKQPTNQDDMNVLSVYYLKNIANVDGVTIDHVYTCYNEAKRRSPTNLANSLALTASRKRLLDTADLQSIELTPSGKNHVEYDLPGTKKS